jgi:lambda repressor-like predicted transcriptional regulator
MAPAFNVRLAAENWRAMASPRSTDRSAREDAVVELRRKGWTFAAIRAELGLGSGQLAPILRGRIPEDERRRLDHAIRVNALARQGITDDGRLGLAQAARAAGVRQPALRERIESGDIRAKRIVRGTRVDFRIDRQQLFEDLEPFRCAYDDCDRYALGTSRGCRVHCSSLALGGKQRPAEVVAKITALKRERYPVAGERFCEHCGKSLGVKSVARVQRGDGHYCSLACAGAERRQKWEQLTLELAERGELIVARAAQQLRVHPVSVNGYIRAGGLQGAAQKFEGIEFRTVRQQDLDAFLRRFATTGGHERRNWQNPPFVVKIFKARGIIAKRAAEKGLTEAEAVALIRADAEQRRKLIAARRRGRRAAHRVAAHHEEWLVALREVRDYHERRHCVGEAMPSDWQLYLEVALEDYLAHPERWEYDPNAAPNAATTRVAKAIKALQIPPT